MYEPFLFVVKIISNAGVCANAIFSILYKNTIKHTKSYFLLQRIHAKINSILMFLSKFYSKKYKQNNDEKYNTTNKIYPFN